MELKVGTPQRQLIQDASVLLRQTYIDVANIELLLVVLMSDLPNQAQVKLTYKTSMTQFTNLLLISFILYV